MRTDPSSAGRELRRSLAILAVIALLFGVAEIAGRLTAETGTLDRILALLERDPVLLWRLRAGLDTVFEGARVRTNSHHTRGPSFDTEEPRRRLRVVCLGASPTFGWGVDEAQTYPAVLERALQKRGLDVQVINAGVPGYTSWQGLRWLKSGGPLEWHPDALTIAYDLNDLDRFRFFGNNGRTDADQPPSSETAAAVQNLLNRSAAYRMFRKSLMGAVGRRGDFEAADMPRRVPVEDYAANLTEISHLARARGLDLVYLKMPFHFPFDRVKVRDPERAAKRRREAGEALARGDRDAARRAFEESLEADPTQGGIYEPYVKLLAEMGEDEAAGRVRWLIPFIYAFSDRADLRYNAAVADVALKTGRPLADVVEAFDRDGRGDGLWNSAEDPFHPNAAGHAIVAEIVADILEPILRKRG